MNTLLTICWPAIGTMLAITVGVCFFVLMLDWASELEWSWKKIVGVSALSILIIAILVVLYLSLANTFCK